MAITLIGNKMIILELQHQNYILTVQDLPEIHHVKVHPFKEMAALIKNGFNNKAVETFKRDVLTETHTINPETIANALEKKYGQQVAMLYRNTHKRAE